MAKLAASEASTFVSHQVSAGGITYITHVTCRVDYTAEIGV